MSTFNDYGIILSSHDLGESDKILNIYTKENGLLRAVAKGSRKASSKFGGKIDQFSCCYFHFANGKNLSTVCDCEQINSFSLLRSDLYRLTNAVLFLEIVSNFAHEDEHDSHHVYDLLYESLNNLQKSTVPYKDSIIFISNFLSLHGYKPQLDMCVHCSADVSKEPSPEEGIPYSSILGGVLCKECSKIILHKKVKQSVLRASCFTPQISTLHKEDIRLTLDLLREHLDIRAKNKIKSFDLVLSL